MDATPAKSRWFDWLWVFLWGLLSTIWCLSASPRLSATFDEPFYIQEGLKGWRSGSNDRFMRAGTMPLPVDVETLPLYLWEQFRGAPFDVEADFGQLLPVARAGNLVFWWILLIYSWRLANFLRGPWAGRLAVALVAGEPNLLAHATLATTDISVTALLVGFFYHFLKGRDGVWAQRVGVPAVWYALAVLGKASGMVFGVFCMLAVEFYRLSETGTLFPAEKSTWRDKIAHLWGETRGFREDALRIFGIGMCLVFLYCGTDWQPQKSFVKWAGSLPDGALKTVMEPVSENLCLFPNAGEALVYQFKHNMRGHGVYLMGDWERRAIWYYFPLTLAMKLSLPLLALTTILLLLRPRAMFSSVGVLALMMFLFSFNCRVQIGIRLILPLVAFLLVAAAMGFVRAVPARWGTFRKEMFFATVIGAGLVPAATVWPHGLAYFNQLSGGRSEGYRYLGDSNFDWGQGLPDLKEWYASHTDQPLRVWYFGMDPQVFQEPFVLTRMHTMNLNSPEDAEKELRGSYFAVGATILHGNPDVNPAWKHTLELLKSRTPVARTLTFFIYDFAP